MFSCIAAIDTNYGIGLKNDLPWNLPTDLRFFERKTTSTNDPLRINVMIVGTRTWASVGKKSFPRRATCVLTRDKTKFDDIAKSGCFGFTSLDEALAFCQSHISPQNETEKHNFIQQNVLFESIFICGGRNVYAEAMKHKNCESLIITRVYHAFDCDTFFPEIDEKQFPIESKSDVFSDKEIKLQFFIHKNISLSTTLSKQTVIPKHEELQYLEAINDVMQNGITKQSRAGAILQKWGLMLRFSLKDSFPLLTTKRVFWRGVVEELLWFLRGSTNAKELADKNVHIWDANGTREFLDATGLTKNEENDLGPVYGFQWRHFGAQYKTMHDDYSGQGIDQIATIIKQIKTDPNSRRIILSAWNPSALTAMALPPCHVLSQFTVNNGELSSILFQRSADMALGVPFNIASYALLTEMLAHVCNLRCGSFVHCIADAHVYQNHVAPLQEQLKRTPFPFPKLKLNPKVIDIDQFTFEDIQLCDYKCHDQIKMEMNV